MHLPTPQFSRLVTVLAFDLNDPSLDSMILTWDHIATRYLNRLADHREVAGKIESIRLLAIHDAIHAVFRSGNSYLFHGFSPGNSIAAALAATAQASHDILAAAFDNPEDLANLAHALEESLSLIPDPQEAASGVIVGAASSATFERTFGPLSASQQLAEADFNAGRDQLASQVVRFADVRRAAGERRRSA
jgi:hypothetical protein